MFFKLLVKAVLYAIAFVWLIPALGIGITVHGGFGVAVGLGVAFAVVSWLVAVALEAGTLLTGGLLGCLLFFVWWLIPAACIHFTAELFPANLSVASFWSAVWGGLVLMIMSGISAGITSKKSS